MLHEPIAIEVIPATLRCCTIFLATNAVLLTIGRIFPPRCFSAGFKPTMTVALIYLFLLQYRSTVRLHTSLMAFFEATGLIGTFSTIAGILDSIRKCYKAKKKISKLVSEGLLSLGHINQLAPQICRFLQVGGIGLGEFCSIAAKIIKVEVDLVNMGGKLKKMNKMYRLCSAPETVSALESICARLSQMETEMRLLVTSARSDVKTSILLEAFGPILAVAEELIPHVEGLKEKQRLLVDARIAFGTHVLASRMNRLVTRNTEGVYHFIMGKMFFEGLAVEVDHAKSASFFQCAISYGNIKALVYLARQYQRGLGITEDQCKAVELYKNGAELEDPECLFEMGRCYKYGYGVEKNDGMKFYYYAKAANFGLVDGQRGMGSCLFTGKGTEVDLERAANFYKVAAEAGDKNALCHYGECMLYGDGVEKNEKFGVELFKIALAAGSIEALVNLGDCYLKGLGVERDVDKGLRLYRAAGDENYSSAPEALINKCFMYGGGVPQSNAKGVRYLQETAAGGNSYALRILADLYRKGIGAENNKRKAFVSYKRAAALGSWPANLSLGEMFRDGEGVAVNMKKAIHHFEVHAKYEKDESHWNLALIYSVEEGYLNKNRAVYHYRLAADLGNLQARQVLGQYCESISGPRKSSFKNKELEMFLRKVKSQFYTRRNNLPNILAPQGLQSMETLDGTISDFANSQATIPSSNPSVAVDPTSQSEPAKYLPPMRAVSARSLLEFLGEKYAYWWVLPFGLFILTVIFILEIHEERK